MVHISSAFDGGNIRCLDDTNPSDLVCEIEGDSQSDFYQWFYFRLCGARNQDCRIRLVNAGGAAYPAGWDGYRAVASYDRQDWFRIPTCYEQGELIFSLRPEQDSVYFAYFAPYSMERPRRFDRQITTISPCPYRGHRAQCRGARSRPHPYSRPE